MSTYISSHTLKYHMMEYQIDDIYQGNKPKDSKNPPVQKCTFMRAPNANMPARADAMSPANQQVQLSIKMLAFRSSLKSKLAFELM